MGFWGWFLTILGSTFVLVILLMESASIWIRRHPELLAQPFSGVNIPPGFEADIDEVQRLEAQSRRHPHVIGGLIQIYERILGRLRPGDYPAFRAKIQNMLGMAYAKLPTGDRAANLTQAIACFHEALRFRTPETAPLDYAMTQNNLGSAYAKLPTGDRGTNLAQAIACYQQALRFQTPETAPLDYAMTQNNLGITYRNLPTGDRGANLAQAIACYQQALRFWTPEAAPFDYATTQNNLGVAYYCFVTLLI
jgi:tetratricopeptide (TPR) repeat protein